VAGARILEAQAQRNIAAGNLFPQSQSAFADYTRVKLSTNTANPPLDAWFSNWDAGLTASWELDFWGRFRRAVEAADAELDGSVENYDDVLVVLLSDVAATYVEYRTFQQRLVYARANVDIQRRAAQLALDKFQGGATTERDTQQANQVLAQTEALIPSLEIGKRQAANRLCTLLGLPPTDLEAMLGEGPIPSVPTHAVVGVPADLVRRRPDVRRAEREVAAQSARIGIAVSDLYPHISVLGTIGVEGERFADLFRNGSMIGNIGPSIRWDILNYGRLVNNVRVQDARFQAAAYAYQDQVLTAGREVEDALIAFLLTQEQTRYLGDSVTAANRTVEITNEQYVQGAVDFTAVFLFEATLTSQQDLYAASQGDVALSLIAIYRALGGGWQIRLGNGMAASPDEQMPLLDEMPLREAVDNDIQFQSVSFEDTFGELLDAKTTSATGTANQSDVLSKNNGFPVRQL
jgi:NodT family efflux transporter outer membrane factor (OMF) lipoprotein